jgi:lipoprotein LprG
MPRSRPFVHTLAALVALTLALTSAACSGKKKSTGGGGLPSGSELLNASSAKMREVKTAHFLITANGTISGLALHRAEGDLTREGSAQGSAQVEQFGANVELTFVVVGDKLFVKGPTGGWQQLPLALASTVYDPSAILDKDRGIPKVLATAKNAKTEAQESVDGQDAYRVAATMDGSVLSSVVPGATGDVPAKLWVAVDSKLLLKATFTLDGGSVTVSFSKFDAPVNISAPV